MKKKITVIGATGFVGAPVTRALINAGYQVTALVRDIGKAEKIFPAGVTFIKGDLQNRNDIAKAIQNAESVYINLNTTFNDTGSGFVPERDGVDNIVAELKVSNVRQVGLLTSFLSKNYKGTWWVMKVKEDAVEKIKTCGKPYTIFCSASIMENFKGGMRQGKKINVIGKSSEVSWWLAADDLGKQVANAFRTDKALNRIYSMQGLEPFTLTRAAKIYVDNYRGEKLSVARLPMGMAKFLAFFIKPLKFVVPLAKTINSTKEPFEAQPTWDELGKPEISLIRFAQNHLREK